MVISIIEKEFVSISLVCTSIIGCVLYWSNVLASCSPNIDVIINSDPFFSMDSKISTLRII